MCSINSGKLVRKEFASEAEVNESLEKFYSYFRSMPDNCCVPLCHKSGYRVGPDGKKVTYHELPLRNPKRLKVFDKRIDYCIYLPI